MGILEKKELEPDNIFTRNGFTFESLNATGDLKNCYEKYVELSDTYSAFIAISLETGETVIYIEYECGGEVSSHSTTISLTDSFGDKRDEYDIFKELDEEVTYWTESED